MAPSSAFAALQKTLQNAHSGPRYEDGWRSLPEVARELGLTLGSAANARSKWGRMGLVDRWDGSLPGPSGRLVRAGRYRIKPGAEKSSEK